MIEIRRGYNEDCARACLEASNAPASKLKGTIFFGIYDPDPVGALVFELPYVHVGVKPEARGRIGFALKAAMNQVLQVAPMLIAPIAPSNRRAIRLAEGLGFEFMFEHQNRRYYWRKSNES